MQSNELPQVTLENMMIAAQAAQWSRLQVASALSRERRIVPPQPPQAGMVGSWSHSAL